MGFIPIDPVGAKALLDNGEALLWDIRDPHSFAQGHIPKAQRLDNQNLAEKMAATAQQQPLIICCYHGISSQQAADYLLGQGYQQIYNLEGGFAAWQAKFPSDIASLD